MDTIRHKCHQWRTLPAPPILAVLQDDPINPDKLAPADRAVWDQFVDFIHGGYRWEQFIPGPGGAWVTAVIVLGRPHWVTFNCPPVPPNW